MPGSGIARSARNLGVMCAVLWTFAPTGLNPGAQEMPVLRSTTHLVEVNAVVHDKKGAPVKGLTRDDFTVLDNGKKQTINIFSVESSRAAHAPLQPLPLDTFSNRVNREGGIPANVAVILLDTLNTQFAGRAWARQQLIKLLNQLQPGDRVAVCVLGPRLRMVLDFTSDPAPFIEALRHGGGGLGDVPHVSHPNAAFANPFPGLTGPSAVVWAQFERALNESDQASSNQDWQYLTLPAIAAIAQHLSGLPGRKSLIWVTGDFPGLSNREVRVKNDTLMRELDSADVALYIVDARGLSGSSDYAADMAPGPSRPRSAVTGSSTTGAMDYYAQQTGGRAFYNSNDLKGSIRSALDDSELTYTLGYYPSDASWDGRSHALEVRVDRPGVAVRHRRSYLAAPDAPPEKADPLALLKKAASSPLDHTDLGLTATLKPLENPGGNKFHVTVLVDQRSVTFQPAQGARKVVLNVLVGQYSEQGDALGGDFHTLAVNLKDREYEKDVRAGGVTLTFNEELMPRAEELRLVVRDGPSGSIGSLHMPLGQLRQPSR